ncbi:DUF4783 domain-containing protein [Cyclobacterium xiamenense]|uniref:DUF4783 domain-containing protein n=1 Tax=Cyclobacterium xiamenense TaxID=1297121 RepID=UPI0035CFCD89
MTTFAQGYEKDVEFAMQQGSSKELSKYLDSRVEISFDNSKHDFSRSQAEIVLRDFFKDQPSQGFDLQQVGQTSETVSYLIGTYRSTGNSFRVLIRRKKNDQQSFLIYSMEFIRQ